MKSPPNLQAQLKNTRQNKTSVFNRDCSAILKEKLFLKNAQHFKKNKTPTHQTDKKALGK